MLAHQIFGIMDAFMLGTKLGAVMWIFFGLVTTLYIRRDQIAMKSTENGIEAEKAGESNVLAPRAFERNSDARQWLKRLGGSFLPFVYWALFSMLAISFVGDQPYISLAIALTGGGILGFICTTRLEAKSSHSRME
jgi:hypothetical protein